jgi:hypothetical protein
MKKVKVSLLALSLLAGGSLAASAAAAAPGTGSDYRVIINWSSNATTTAAPIFFITDAPVTGTNGTFIAQVLPSRSSVFNDGSGKVDGAAVYRVTLGSSGTNGASTAAADMVCTVTGNITLKNSVPTVTLNIKGNGASIDSAGTIGNANMSLKFVGSGSSSTNAGDVFTGTFSGTVNTGIKGSKPFKVDQTTAGTAPAFADPVIFDGAVVQSPNSKLFTMASIGDATQVTGSGSENVKKQSYTVNTKGFGFSKGANLNLSGATAVVTNLWIILDQTNLTQATIVIPGKADAKGKIAGQAVKATGATVLPLPVALP